MYYFVNILSSTLWMKKLRLREFRHVAQCQSQNVAEQRFKFQIPGSSSTKIKTRSFHEWEGSDESRLLGNLVRLSEGRGPTALSMAFKRKYSNPASYSHILGK